MSKIKRILLLTVILIASSLSSCATPLQEDIGIVLAGYQPCELKTSEQLPISLKGAIPADASIEWAASGGSFNPANGFPTVYTAPAQAGKVVITVNVKINGIKQVYNVPCTIKAEAATLTSTPEPTGTPTATQTATIPLPTTTATATATTSPTAAPTLTPTPDWIVLASTENIQGWTADYRNAKGKAILNSVSEVPGKDGSAIRLSFDVTDWGYVTLTHNLRAKDMLISASGVRFDYQGGDQNNSGTNNTIEVKLLFRWPGDKDDTTFGLLLNGTTNTNGAWKTAEIPYDQITCLFPQALCVKHPEMNFNYILRMDYVVSNKPDKGDTGGPGYVIFEDLVGVK